MIRGRNWHIIYSGYDNDKIHLIREILNQYVIPTGYTEEHDYGIYGFVWVEKKEYERALKVLKDHSFITEEQYNNEISELEQKSLRRKRKKQEG